MWIPEWIAEPSRALWPGAFEASGPWASRVPPERECRLLSPPGRRIPPAASPVRLDLPSCACNVQF